VQAAGRLDALAQAQGMVFGLDSIKQLDRLLGSPACSLQAVHVAGTNGKGSVAGKVARSLEKAGYCTGLYTSPHLVDYTERLQIDGEAISKEEFAGIIEEGFRLRAEKGLKVTAFDLITAMSFSYFHRKQVDLAVVEVGLGGTLDSTNILTPAVSVITSIGFDHISLLGPTLAAIAMQKAGIMKAGIPVVLGPNVPISVLQERAKEVGSPCVLVPSAVDFETADQENTRIAQAVLTLLKPKMGKLTSAHLNSAAEYTPFGRRQEVVLPNNARLILDTGHNISALSRLFYDLMHTYPAHRFQAVMGLSADKLVYLCVEEVMKHVEKLHFVSSGYHRLLDWQKMREVGLGIDPFVVGHCGQVGDVLPKAISELKSDEILVICGSFFIMSDVYSTLHSLNIPLPSPNSQS